MYAESMYRAKLHVTNLKSPDVSRILTSRGRFWQNRIPSRKSAESNKKPPGPRGTQGEGVERCRAQTVGTLVEKKFEIKPFGVVREGFRL